MIFEKRAESKASSHVELAALTEAFLHGKWIFGIRETYPEGKFTERSDAGHPDSGALKAGARRNPGSFRGTKSLPVLWDVTK
ncbi:hypothetical protein HZH66_005315 [Vespula vulgaris]|uniref:Uncharacterized protein n=1 Tax=Vespula vulgaris TaxID=7454 RepID=A0A834KAF1_VESVU|nr:hypothetical protein HZH66_005315 [Vespula vulgaris]